MKRIALLLILALGVPLTARADDASRRDKAKELLILLHTDRLLQQMMEGMKQQSISAAGKMAGDNVTAAQKARLSDFQTQLFSLIESQLSYTSLEPDYVKLYADNFTDEDLDDILAFYKSPAGKSMIEKLPALTAQSFQLAQVRMSALIPQIKQMIADFAKSCPDCNSKPVAGIGGMAGFGGGPPPAVRLGNALPDPAFAGQAPRVPAGVMAGNIIQRTSPVYPPIARAAHVQGVVIMRAIIGKDGRIQKLETISGPSMLVSAAEDAVKQWVYKPYLLNGEPVEVATTINVNFTFANPAQPATPSIPPESTPASDVPSATGGATPQ